ncbi:hypothetical protein V496_01233 [Pseudogymnoascus sp. VKM F-4515 (FW-2607)]|nr:hypothetical protein V496_01233 [Pseudogymnoascus sp. VKM F-4515 (FW-2607)]
MFHNGFNGLNEDELRCASIFWERGREDLASCFIGSRKVQRFFFALGAGSSFLDRKTFIDLFMAIKRAFVDAAWSLAPRATATIRSALGTRLTCTTLRAVCIANSVVRRIAVCTPLTVAAVPAKPPAAAAQKTAHVAAPGPVGAHNVAHAVPANAPTPAPTMAPTPPHTFVVIAAAVEPQYVCWSRQSGHLSKHIPVWLQVLCCFRTNWIRSDDDFIWPSTGGAAVIL